MTRDPGDWVDRRALDERGDLLGVVVDAYIDPATHRVSWLAVATGYFGTRVAVVPVQGAVRRGGDVVLAHDRHTITNAPMVDVVVGVDPTQQQSLIDHYAAPRSATPADTPERGT